MDGKRRLVLAATVCGLAVVVSSTDLRVLPGLLSLAPPVIAIVMAFLFRSVLPALLLGLWAGAWVLEGLDLRGLFLSLLGLFGERVPAALLDPDHIAVILFIMMIGGLIGILASNGGMLAVVGAIQKVAHTRRAGQLLTTGLGFTIFFDDYANTLLVGKTMRPLTDRLRVSREKLAFIVDSTASPVAGLALVSTWIGYEVGMIDANQPSAVGHSAYSVFLASLPYCFYPILILVFLVAVVASVLAGSIWGDHASPISDTTILSSMSASCDHLEHVRTQMPYALAVGAVALVVGILPVSFGMPVWLGLTASAALTAGLPYLVGRRVGASADVEAEETKKHT